MVCACNPSDGEMKGGRQRQVDPGKLMGQLSGSTWQSSRSMRDPVSNKSWKVPENYTPGFPVTSPTTENTYIRAPSHSNSHIHTHKRVKEKKTKIETVLNTGALYTKVETSKRRHLGIL